MKAVITQSTGQTALTEIEPPHIGQGDLLLRLRCCGLCGTDIHKIVHQTVEPGTVLGHELVGEIEDPGETDFGKGDRIVVPHHVACGQCGFCRRGHQPMCTQFKRNLFDPGGFAELIAVRAPGPQGSARLLSTELTDDVAVFFEPAACVVRSVQRAKIRASDPTVCILGGGSMGLLHLLVLRCLHDARILLIEPLAERRRLAERLGADATCDPVTASDTMRRLNVEGADAVFDTVGGSTPLDLALELCRDGGSVVLFAHASQGSSNHIELDRIFKAEHTVVGSYSSSTSNLQRAFELLASGQLDPTPLITHHLPLSEFGRALELCRQNEALKVLIVPDGAEAS